MKTDFLAVTFSGECKAILDGSGDLVTVWHYVEIDN